MDVDVLIANGTVYDGSGAAGVRADVGVRGDRITAVGDLDGANAVTTLDATGHAVCPGFVDPHTHCHVDVDRDVLHCDNLLRQGITTVVAGNCGTSGWPVADHLAKVEREGFKSNYATLVGHHTVRRLVMHESSSPWPDVAQMRAVQDLIRRGLEEGAIGVTLGYAQRHETFHELTQVARPAAEAGAIVTSHIRSEAEGLLQAVAEMIEIGQEAGVPVHVSHLKASNPGNWGKIDTALMLLEDAVSRGIDIAADRYPYIGWHGGSTNVMPRWCYEEARKRGGIERLADPDCVDEVREGVRQHLAVFGGPDKLMFTSLREPDPEVDGRTVADLMDAWRMDVHEVALEIERRSAAGSRIGAVGFTMNEENLGKVLRHPLVMVGTDAHLESYGTYATHPRNYGTYPRILGRYVREEGLFSLGTAIRKMTAMPADRFKLSGRGWLRPGAFADVVVFDPERVADNATFVSAHQYPNGIPHVLVNGDIAVENGVTRPEHFGRVLRST